MFVELEDGILCRLGVMRKQLIESGDRDAALGDLLVSQSIFKL